MWGGGVQNLERASQGANSASYVAPSSEDLRVQYLLECTHMVKVITAVDFEKFEHS